MRRASVVLAALLLVCVAPASRGEQPGSGAPIESKADLEIWFVRHAESEINVTDSWTRPDTDVSFPLTKEGMRQARELANRLRDVDIVEIYSSTRLRALQTASAVGFMQELPVRLAPEMVEIDVGVDLSTEDPVGVWKRIHEEWRTDPTARHGRGESLVDVRRRVSSFIDRLMDEQRHRGGVVLVAGHSGSIGRGVLSLCRNPVERDSLEPASLPHTAMLKARIENGGLICTMWANQSIGGATQ